MEKYIDFTSQKLICFGRTAIDGSKLKICWPGSGFNFSFSGNEARIHFGEFKSDRHFYFKITVDKQSQVHCVCCSNQIIVLRGLKDGIHKVNVTKVTESQTCAEITKIVICGNAVDFETPEALPKLKAEFIGDSLTAGFGNLSEPDAGIYRASEQDVTYGYSYLTAKALNADGRYICVSGKGIFNNWDGSKENRIPDFYTKRVLDSDEKHDFSSWQPDIIFINAGTNDITAKTDPKDFKKAFFDFVLNVSELNPSASFVCIHGLTTDKFENAFHDLEKMLKEHFSETNKKIEFVKFTPISSQLYGALGHPNPKAHASFTRKVINAAKKLLK
jgi:lysophospholipase L1-like esterase